MTDTQQKIFDSMTDAEKAEMRKDLNLPPEKKEGEAVIKITNDDIKKWAASYQNK